MKHLLTSPEFAGPASPHTSNFDSAATGRSHYKAIDHHHTNSPTAGYFQRKNDDKITTPALDAAITRRLHTNSPTARNFRRKNDDETTPPPLDAAITRRLTTSTQTPQRQGIFNAKTTTKRRRHHWTQPPTISAVLQGVEPPWHTKTKRCQPPDLNGYPSLRIREKCKHQHLGFLFDTLPRVYLKFPVLLRLAVFAVVFFQKTLF